MDGWTCLNCQQTFVVKDYVPPIPRHLLKTNDPPLASEESELRKQNVIARIESDILQLDETINHLTRTLQALKQQRRTMEESLAAAKGVLSPIRRVPKEIIGEIILDALGYNSNLEVAVSLWTKEGPWTYSQVCQLWRQEVFSYPFMWATIRVDDGWHPLRRQDGDILRTLLERAKSWPLHITLCLSRESSISQNVLATAVEKSTSWRDATLILAPELLEKLTMLQNRVPSLESLELGVGISSDEEVVCPHLVNVFSVAPTLRRVRFSGIGNLDAFNLPWSQLTHFEDEFSTKSLDETSPSHAKSGPIYIGSPADG